MQQGGGEVVHPIYLLPKDLKKLGHKNAIKHEDRGALYTFSYSPKNPPPPPSKEFENDCADVVVLTQNTR